ncbi:hypothetical protein FACS189472_06010 [Alphaproteobacteria bacterium]|nr:hypothetical protein FACS189472_06010 [Alphaproteobacteria bacterium]
MTDKSAKTPKNGDKIVDRTKALDELKEKWPSPFVSRDRIEEFTQGLFKQTSMSTLDARGDGIKRRYRIGNRVFYETDAVVEWLKTKVRGV